MAQPQYTQETVSSMTDVELADHLMRWANAREVASRSRGNKGKKPLDTKLLTEAASRLMGLKK